MTDLQWIKATASGQTGECVEMADLGDGQVGVRDSKNPEAGYLTFRRSQIAAWLDGARDGGFDRFA